MISLKRREKQFMANILIVDDEREIRNMLERTLSKNGFHCVQAADAAVARALLERQPFELALVDINMPGESGLDFVLFARQAFPDMMVIMVTGVDDANSIASAIEAGIYSYVLKPFELNQMLLHVKNALRHQEADRSIRQYRENLEEMLAQKVREVKESEEKFRAISSSAHDAIVTIDDQGNIVLWNGAAERMFGYASDEVLGKNIHELLAPRRYQKAYEKAFATFQASDEGVVIANTLELEAKRKDGQEIPIELSLSSAKLSGKWHAFGIVRDITQRRKAIEELKKSEERNRIFLEAAQEGIAVSRAGVQLFVNHELAKMFGYENPSDLEGKENALVVHPDDRDRVNEISRKRSQGDAAPSRYEFKGIRKDGTTIDVAVAVTQTMYLGKPADIAFLMDISERKRAQRIIESERAMFHAMLDSITEMIYVADPETYEVLYVNKAFEDALGRNPVGSICYREFQNLDVPCDYCTNQVILEKKGRPYFWEFHNPGLDRDYKIVDRIIRWPDGRDVRFEFAMDITDLKTAQDELKKAHTKTELLLGAMTCIMIVVDEEDRIVEWNSSAEETFGMTYDEVYGKTLSECGLKWPGKGVYEAIGHCRESDERCRLDDIRYEGKDGKERFLGMTISRVAAEDGTAIGALIRASDITDQRLLESQLVQAQKLESIGQLAAGIAHEINTPTQYVGDNNRFLKEGFEDLDRLVEKYQELARRCKDGTGVGEILKALEETAEEIDLDYLRREIPAAIEQSLEGVERVAKIVRAMKEFSHPGGEGKEPTNINKAIENTVTVARNEWKYVADLEMDFDETLQPVACHQGELNQVILNMIVNAAHAIADVVGNNTGGKGAITISTRKNGKWAEIHIKDTGAGIPAEIRSKIFDPFFTTKEVGRGTGQGLSIAHSVIVEKHGGTIDVESGPGKGSSFTIRLPLEG
jgi:PAS domain S-box-containing protein